jgi:predicted nucleic-acid-binding protein
LIGIDTNVLVRYLTGDDAVQAERARMIMEHEVSESNPGFISLVTVAEVAWVLESVYRIRREELADAITRILQADHFLVQNEREVYTAMVALKSGEAGFSDALIGALGVWAGCSHTVTFDRKAAQLSGFKPA